MVDLEKEKLIVLTMFREEVADILQHLSDMFMHTTKTTNLYEHVKGYVEGCPLATLPILAKSIDEINAQIWCKERSRK